jgi:hypothetical protein
VATSRRRFGSRGLRATPQGYAPWTPLLEGTEVSSHDVLGCAIGQ